jgi:diguanylate cyclase (GGDEF)-like protein/PAS domain S-box-containing protein
MIRELNLLLAEDDDDDEALLLRELRKAGYHVKHTRVQNEVTMRAALEAQRWDLVISDHSMPGFDPMRALALLREYDGIVPFLIVSGAIPEEEAVEAMAAGVSDYVMKGNLTRLPPAIERELAEAEERRRRRRAEGEVRRIAAIVDSSFDAIIGETLDGEVTSWNPAAERIFGFRADEMVGKRMDVLVPPEHKKELDELVARVLNGERVEEHETVRLTKDGGLLDVSLTISPIRDEHGAIAGISKIARDITERKRTEEQLIHLSDHDALTGLFNRRRFEEELARLVAYTRRYRAAPAALLLLDLDNFKYVNDTLGHGAGDRLICSVAAVLRRGLRETDVLARLGADEFAILLPQVDAEGARTAAESLREAIATQPPLGAPGLTITASVGIATITGDALVSDPLVHADLALQDIKERGRNGVSEYRPEDRERLATRIGWEDRIRRALDEDRFVLYFQPIVDLATGKVTKGEVLLRLVENGEVIPPGAYLDVAERSGLILDIDRWVVRTAIELLAKPGALPAERVEVNLSGRSLQETGLVESIEADLVRTGVDPSRLIFEITETAVIANMDDAARLARRLQAAGCKVALDDFGTGFGSFYYLKYLPVDVLKIDGEFIRNLPASPTDQLMVKAIAQVAQGLGVTTVAEFVEDAETVLLLAEYGIDFGQGYHLGRPHALEAFSPARLTPAGSSPSSAR